VVCNGSCQLILSHAPGATLQDLCKIDFGCYNILLSYCGWYLVACLNIAAICHARYMHSAMPQNSITRSRRCFSDLWTQDIADTRLQAVITCSVIFVLITLYLRVVIAFGCALTTCAMWKVTILYCLFVSWRIARNAVSLTLSGLEGAGRHWLASVVNLRLLVLVESCYFIW